MKNLVNFTTRTFSILSVLFLMLAFALPTDVLGQEGFIRIKNNTGRQANDLHIAFIGQAPALVTRSVNGVRQPHGNVFRNGRTRGGRQVVWDFDNATQNVPHGTSVSILINYARNRADVPQTPRIDWRNSYWTWNGQRIPVRRRPNALAPGDVEILGIALDPQTKQPQLPKSPDDGKNDQAGGNQGGGNQGGIDGGNDGGNQGGPPPAQGEPAKCECLGVTFSVNLKVLKNGRVVRQKAMNVNIPASEMQDARRGSGKTWRKRINISKTTLPVANDEVVEMEVTNVHIRCRCNPPTSGDCQAYPFSRAKNPGSKLGLNTVSTQPKDKMIPPGGGDKVRFQSIHNIPPYADISVSGICIGCGGQQGAARVRGELRINLNQRTDSGIPQGGQGGNQGTGGNQGGNNQGGNNQGGNNQGGNDGGSSGGSSGGNSGGNNSGGNNSGGNNSGGSSGGSSGGNSGHQGGNNQGGSSGGGANNQNAEGEKIQNFLKNYQQTGNFQGICGTGLANMSQMFPQEYQKFLEREEQIKQWLQSKGVPLPPGCSAGNQNQLPPAHQDLRNQIGDEAYRAHLQRNKAQHGNYQGLCGSSLVELQRNFPKLYQEYLERERALEEFMN